MNTLTQTATPQSVLRTPHTILQFGAGLLGRLRNGWTLAWTTLLTGLLLGTTPAQADQHPLGCTGSALGINLFTDSTDVHIGESIRYSVTVFNGLPGSPRLACDATGIIAYVVTPDGLTNQLTLRRTTLVQSDADFYPNVVTYVVRAQDILPDGTVRATAHDDGDIHQNDTNSRGGADQGLNSEVVQPCIQVNANCTGSTGQFGAITFTGTVRNCGNAPLDNVTVSNQVNGGSFQILGPFSLAIGQSKTFSGSWVPLNPCAASTSTFMVAGTDGLTITRTVTATTATTCQNTLTPAIRVTQACPVGPIHPGQLLTYTGTVTNTGDVTLTNVMVLGDHPANTVVYTIASLPPGAGSSFTGSYVAPVDCATSSGVVATGTSVCGVPVSDRASITCAILTNPLISVTTQCSTNAVVPGGLQTYNGTVKNTGDIPLKNVVVTSDRPAANTTVFTVATLAPGEAANFSGTYTVPLVNACAVTATVVAAGHDSCTDAAVTATSAVTCGVTTAPQIAVTLACPAAAATVGGLVTYTGTVSNPGNVTLNNITVMDTQSVPPTVFTVATLAPGASANFTASFTAPLDACSVSTTVNASGTDSCTSKPVTATQSATCPLLTTPGLALTQNCPATPAVPGGLLSYTGTVRNSGNVTLTNVVVLNSLSGATPVFTAATLAPGVTASFTGSYLAPTNCSATSVSTATATSLCGVAATATATTTCTILTTPLISVTTVCPATSVLPGGLLTYTGTVSNSGKVTLTNIIVTGDRPTTNTTLFTAATLAPGASLNFTGSYLVPTNCCVVSSTVHASGEGCDGMIATDTETRTCTVLTLPQIVVTKNCTSAGLLHAGDLLTYSGTVSNAGNIVLINVRVVNDQTPNNPPVAGPLSLAPGESYDYVASYVVPADFCGTDTVTASGLNACTLLTVTDRVTTTCPVSTPPPHIAVTKDCPLVPTPRGGLYTFTGTVSNPGTVTLVNVYVVDNQPVSNSPVLGPITLAPGETVRFTNSYIAPKCCCLIVDTLTASGQSRCSSASVMATATTVCPLLSAPAIAVVPNCPSDPILKGTLYRFSGYVTNTGDVTLTNVFVFGPQGTNAPVLGPTELAPGESATYFGFYTVLPDTCSVAVTATGRDTCGGNAVAHTAGCPVANTPQIAVTQNCPPGPVRPGGLLTFTGTVRNLGDITLTNVVVRNDRSGSTPLLTVASLAPGASTNFIGSYLAPTNCSSMSTSVATGTSICGVAVTNTASSTCPILTTPQLAFTVNCPAGPVLPGGPLVYSGMVRNTGDITLTNVVVFSDRPVANTRVLTLATLPSGASTNFTSNVTAPLNACSVTTGFSAAGSDVCTLRAVTNTASTTCPVLTAQSIVVTLNCPAVPVAPGGSVTFSGTVRNSGNITLTNVSVMSGLPVSGAPIATQITRRNGDVLVSWTATPGVTYRVQYRADLGDPTWTDLAGDVTASGTVASKEDPTGANAQRFYRVMLASGSPVGGLLTLAPGAVSSFSFSIIAPLDACSVNGTVSVQGTSNCSGVPVTDTTTATCALVTTPTLLVTQNCPPSPATPGGLLTITGTVKNTGNITLNNVVVTNDHTGSLPLLTVLSLAPGASTNFTGSYLAPATGPSTSTSTARGTSLCGVAAANAGSSACPILTTPGLVVTKLCPAVPVAPGGLLTFTGTVTNTGNVTLTNVFVVNSQPVPNTPVLGPITLAPGSGTNFSRSYLTPLNACEVTDTLTATGNSAATGLVLSHTATATCALVTTPTLLVTQNCPPSPATPGGLLTITGTVKNTGNITLNNVVVTNDHTGSLPLLTVLSLAPGASTNFTGSYLAPATGPSTSTSTARGTSLCGVAAANAGSSACPILTTPGLAVTKLCPAVPVAPGGLLTFTGTVTNTGNVTLTNVFVVNSQPVPNTVVLGPITLLPGSGTSFSRSYLTPLNACEVTDTLTATGNSAATGLVLSKTATATCALVTTPAIAVMETCPAGPVTAGSTVTFTGEVSNSGDITLTNVFVFGTQPTNKTPLLGPITLLPGASAPFSGSYVALGGSNPTTNFTIVTNQSLVVITNNTPVVTTNSVTPTFGTINPVTGALTDRFNVPPGLSGLMYADQDENWGPTLFYSIRHGASGADQFDTISTIPPAVGVVTDHFGLSSVGYDALTMAAPDVGYGAVNFYYVRHTGGTATFGVIKAAGASSSSDLWAIPGTGYTGLAFAAANVGGYGANLFYYVRQDTTGLSTFGTINPTPGGIVTDRYTVGPNMDTLVFVPSAVSTWGTAIFAYLRHDAVGSIIGTIDPVTHLATDRLHLGTNRLSTLTFTATDVGYGPNLFYYLRPAGLSLQTNLITTFTTNTVLTFLTNSVFLFTPTNTVTAIGTDICQARTVTAAANCLGPVTPGPLFVLPLSAAAPDVSMAAMVNGQFMLSFLTEKGKNFTVQFKDALSDPVWTDLETVVGTGTKRSVLDMDAGQHPARFYRTLSKP